MSAGETCRIYGSAFQVGRRDKDPFGNELVEPQVFVKGEVAMQPRELGRTIAAFILNTTGEDAMREFAEGVQEGPELAADLNNAEDLPANFFDGPEPEQVPE